MIRTETSNGSSNDDALATPRAPAERASAAQGAYPTGEGKEATPMPRLSTAGLRRLLLRPVRSPLSGGASRRLASALYGRRPESGEPGSRGGAAEFLRRVPLFEGLGRMDLQRLARVVHEREYGDGELISREGTPGAALFVLRRGLVEVTRRGRDGADVTLATLEPPALFDEEAVMGTGTVRWFSTRAHGPVSLLALGRADLDALSEDSPAAANRVLMRLAGVMSARFQNLLDALLVTDSFDAEEPKP